MIGVDVNKILQEACEKAFEDIGVDLVSDMVQDNPDWWSHQLVKVLEPSLKKAIEDKAEKLLREILKEVAEDYCDSRLVEGLARDVIDKKLKNVNLKVGV